ncbi:MAG: ATP-binding protein, partial [Oscillospiraceae bacterium]|nr:ATP-binding protein [Oscillospiraceae bacterium]
MKLSFHANPKRDGFSIPRSVQQSIPIRRVHSDGIFEVGGKFSKTWRFFDIDYKIVSPEKQESLFKAYCAVLNALPTDATAKITLFNRFIDQQAFREAMLLPFQQDGLDKYRAECNANLLDKAADSNNLIQEKYLTISTQKRNLEEARAYFHRVRADIASGFAYLDARIQDVTLNERLRMLHDFFRPGEEQNFLFDLATFERRGHDFRDAIAPEHLRFLGDHYEMGGCVGRVLFLRDYGNQIKDDMITTIMDFPCSMMLSIDIVPLGMRSAIRIAEKAMMSADANATNIQRRQLQRQDYGLTTPYQTAQMQRVGESYMDDLTERDEHMMFGLVTLTHLAGDMEQLNQDTESLKARAGNNCQFATLHYQQEDGLNTVLPYGLRRIDAVRTLTTRSTAVLMPFRTQEIQHKGGLYYGINEVSHNIIVCNRKTMMNGNGFTIGVSGSGKSFAVKNEIVQHALADKDSIIIVDPEREYGDLVRALGGEVITLSASSSNYINALDMPEGYSENDKPLVMKLEFILSLCQQIMDPYALDGADKAVISRSADNIYREYTRRYQGNPPTLRDLREDLLRQNNPFARKLALALEMFTDGTLSHFSHQTNVDASNRIICYDINELGESMKRVALLVMLDAIWNRIVHNRAAGRFTHVYIDEVYLLFSKADGENKSSASF